MSILYDEGQEAIARESRRVVDARTDKQRLLGLLETVGEFDRALWAAAIDQGWTGLGISEDHGGVGLGLIEVGLVAQACGAAAVGAPFLTGGYGAAQAIFRGDDAPAKETWLPRLAAGEAIGAVAFTEGATPLPPAAATTFAHGRLSGVKSGVVAGLAADIAVVWATSRDGGAALALVELAKAERRAIETFDNSRLYADLHFNETPATLLAEGAAAQTLALDLMARMAIVAAHEQVGGAEALLMTARDYALTRKAFGQPIGAFQSVKHRIAELYGLVEIARANCIHAASRVGRSDLLIAAADARLSATEAYDTAARDAVQIHGGIGVTWEAGLHLHMRRARSLAIELGNTFFWEDLLVEELMKATA